MIRNQETVFHYLLRILRVAILVFSVFQGSWHAVKAQDTAEPLNDEMTLNFPDLVVIGSKERIHEISGAGIFLDTHDIRFQSYDDINRVLRKAPGVYLREEDGFGLFPNVSLRGVDPGRSSKVTIMEDGILTAPAPYSAPSAYYSPTTGRMNSIEVLKGSSQVKYGPHTTGGVINYLSTPIPEMRNGYLKFLYGTDNELRTHTYYGNTIETAAGRIGYLLELSARRNDGFKEIDATPDFRASDDTGFTKIEPMLKLSWEPQTTHYQRIEFKAGYTDFDANETYLGLSEEDFKDDPIRRYSASRFDEINTWHTRLSLRHHIELTNDATLTTTAYYHRFHRNWYKLHDIRDIDTDGNGLPQSEEGLDPVRVSLSGALAGTQAGQALEVLKGNRAGKLRVRANNRDYYTYGIQSVADIDFEIGTSKHSLELGLRYHTDRIRRFQWNDELTQATNGTITEAEFQRGGKGAAGDRRQETDAISVFVQDTIQLGDLSIVPGLRYEHLELEFFKRDGVPSEGRSSLDVYAPGIGIQYAVSDDLALFGGVHRGYSTPDPRADAENNIDEETSVGYELGFRYRNSNALQSELVLFWTDFSDLIVTDNIGGSGSGNTENAGDVSASGVEFRLEYDLGIGRSWSFKNPYFLTFTYTDAELDGDSQSADAESMFAAGEDGNDVPYIPEFQFTAGVGVQFEKWGIEISGSYVDETFTTANNSDSQINPFTGDPDSRFGKTDSYFVVDTAGFYQLSETAKLVVNLRNILDDEYIVSRHPHGPRPGRPFSITGGIELTF